MTVCTPALKKAPKPPWPPPTNLCMQGNITVRQIKAIILLWTPPALQGHDAMVEHMEEGEMGELLLENKEERVKHVNKL